MSREEMKARGWSEIDILIISGDAYVDHPSFAAPLIARILLDAGYRVGIAAQPDWKDPQSVCALGRPRLGVGVCGGNIDSMVRLYTAGRRLRREDAYSPGGKIGLIAPHAPVVYSQLAKRAFPGIKVILGGVEASLRRVSHYDYYQDKFRPSELIDAKADLLCYGMGELTMLEIFGRLRDGKDLSGIRGTCRYLGANETKSFKFDENVVELPSYEQVCSDRLAIMRLTKLVEANMNPWNAKPLAQMTNGRILLVEPPREPMSTEDFDRFSTLPFTGVAHFSYKEKIPAWEMIKDSITVVRGCPGGCAFCGLVCHQGRHLVCRSIESVKHSVEELVKKPYFKGTISDLGGAAGNIYQHRPKDAAICKKCRRYSCIFPSICGNYVADEKPLMKLLDIVKEVPGVKHVFINSGIRLDLALLQPHLTEKIIAENTSGQISVAPEHLDGDVLRLMRKGKAGEFEKFRAIFDRVNARTGKKQYIVPYFISNFPGCSQRQMAKVEEYLSKRRWNPQQVQDFIPLPMTMGCAMYCSQTAPDGTPIEVNKGLAQRRIQRDMLKEDHRGKNAQNQHANARTLRKRK